MCYIGYTHIITCFQLVLYILLIIHNFAKHSNFSQNIDQMFTFTFCLSCHLELLLSFNRRKLKWQKIEYLNENVWLLYGIRPFFQIRWHVIMYVYSYHHHYHIPIVLMMSRFCVLLFFLIVIRSSHGQLDGNPPPLPGTG